jgi:hypothetical protein
MKTFFLNFSRMMAIFLALSISSLYAAEEKATSVAGKAHSGGGNKYVVVMNIGKKGNVFAGTFIGRTAYYAWDFIVGVYTDKESRLSIVPIGGQITVNADCQSLHHCKIKSGNLPLGEMKYDPETGNFSITGVGDGTWFQGELMGSYMQII